MSRTLLLGCALLSLVASCEAEAAPQRRLELRVLTDRTESHLAPIFAAYEKVAPVTIKALYLEKGLVSRLQSRPTEADVVITKDADLLEIAKSKHLLQPIASPRIRAAVPAQFRDAADMYFSDSYRARAIFYAKERVKPSELSTYEALADPKWRGRVCVRSGYHDYNLSLLGQMIATNGMERTRRFVTGLRANLARTPTGNDRDQVRAIYEKKCDVALVNSYYMGIMLSSTEQRPWGLAARVFFPDQRASGSYVLRSGLALTTARTNVKAATALLEYMVGEDVQDMIAQLTYAYPVNSKVPMPQINRELGAGQPGITGGIFKIHAVALAEVARQRDAVIRMLDDVQFDRPR